MTVLAYGTMVHVAEAAAEETGVDAEIIDLRTLLPLDIETIDRLGQEDRPLRDRARGDAHQRLRRRARRRWCRSMLLSPGGADRSASPAGTRPIRTRRNGTISPGPQRVGRALAGA